MIFGLGKETINYFHALEHINSNQSTFRRWVKEGWERLDDERLGDFDENNLDFKILSMIFSSSLILSCESLPRGDREEIFELIPPYDFIEGGPARTSVPYKESFKNANEYFEYVEGMREFVEQNAGLGNPLASILNCILIKLNVDKSLIAQVIEPLIKEIEDERVQGMALHQNQYFSNKKIVGDEEDANLVKAFNEHIK